MLNSSLFKRVLLLQCADPCHDQLIIVAAAILVQVVKRFIVMIGRNCATFALLVVVLVGPGTAPAVLIRHLKLCAVGPTHDCSRTDSHLVATTCLLLLAHL